MRINIPFVDLGGQTSAIRAEIDAAIGNIIDQSAFIGGAAVGGFEHGFKTYLGAAHCVGVGNGTDAIYIALKSLGIGPGDEVVTVANSFIATSEAISATGARVVFVDCDPATYTMSVEALQAAITPRTKAIVPVHLYGRPADMPAIMHIAERHGLRVVEDAAQAHGARLDGRACGTFGHAGCFSFYPGKNLGAFGDGGAIVSQDAALASHMRMLANHGRISKYDHEFEGVNSRLDGLQAAVLSVKLGHLERWTEMRRRVAAAYGRGLAGSGLELPSDPQGGRHVYHLYVVRVRDRDRVQAALKDAGIATGIHYPVALPNLTAYRHLGYRPEDFPVSSRYQDEILSLPMYPELSDDAVAYVCETLKSVL